MQIEYKNTETQRLDHFLKEQLEISRNQIQRMVKNGEILVNKEHSTPHRFLKPGDKISYDEAQLAEFKRVKTFNPNPEVELNIIEEDPNFLIIDKPAGILVHPTVKLEEQTIANGLIARYPEITEVGEDPLRPGIVHRLDKNVSGLLLVARNQEAFEYYKYLFKSRQIFKTYYALVHGVMEQPHGEIDFRISRSTAKHGRMAAHPPTEEKGKEALTRYNVEEQFEHVAYLRVEIVTGRTHQIRVHLNAIGHPVVGDPLYKQKRIKQQFDIDRPFLHSSELSFTDQEENDRTFSSPLPKELTEILKKLKR